MTTSPSPLTKVVGSAPVVPYITGAAKGFNNFRKFKKLGKI